MGSFVETLPIATARATLVGLMLALLCGCGSARVRDANPNAIPIGHELAGTGWRLRSGRCIDGRRPYHGRRLEQQLHFDAYRRGLLLVYDEGLEKPHCGRTFVLRATAGARRGSAWRLNEEAGVAVPLACDEPVSPPRFARFLVRGGDLEVHERGAPACGGVDAVMVYAPLPDATYLRGVQLVRRWAAHVNRRDPARVGVLFAEEGAVVDPFTLDASSQPTRFEGRASVARWHDERFARTSWSAVRIMEITEAGEDRYRVVWQYIDPRLAAPLVARATFLVGGGEIFEMTLAAAVELPSASPTHLQSPRRGE